MATDRPDCVGQRDTSRFPLKKVLREAPGERSLLAGGASGGEAPAPSPVRPGRSPAQGGGRGDNPGSCAMKVDLDSRRKCSVLLPEGASPIPGGPGGHSYTAVVRGHSVSKHSTTCLVSPSRPPHRSLPAKG